MGRRARFGGRSSCGGSGAPTTSRYDRQRYAAAGAHFSMPSSSSSSSSISELEEEFENKYEKDSDCRFYYRLLQQYMGDAEAVDGQCLGCDYVKEKMKDCPGVEKRNSCTSKFHLQPLLGKANLANLLMWDETMIIGNDLIESVIPKLHMSSRSKLTSAQRIDDFKNYAYSCQSRGRSVDIITFEVLFLGGGVRFKRESFPSQEELSKLTHQELQCRKFTEMSKREAIYAERGGYEYNADFYTKIMADLNCDELKKKEGGKEGGRRWWWW
ncbi:hypothetical protein LguiB_007631 [Lonicera macranthoides]